VNEELLKRLDLLAAKLNTTGEALWASLLRQARIDAIQDSIMTLGLLVAAWGFYRYIRWAAKEDTEGGHLIVAIVGSVITVILLLIYALSIATEFLNPQYDAFDKILHLLK
jgi:hypothetical protein